MNDVIIRKLERFGPLSDPEKRAVESVALPVRQVEADQDLVREGGRPLHCPLLLDGFACGYKLLETGQRQILAFHLPSDLCDLTSLLLGTRDHSISALTPAKVAFIPYATIASWAERLPGLGQHLWRAALTDAALSREWMVSLGRRTAYQRTAHLLCELMLRMHGARLTDGFTCKLPLTQMHLADALGLTPVHVNRTLQWLRNEGLIEFSGGDLTVWNWRELRRVANFDPTYLHQSIAA